MYNFDVAFYTLPTRLNTALMSMPSTILIKIDNNKLTILENKRKHSISLNMADSTKFNQFDSNTFNTINTIHLIQYSSARN